MNWQTVSEHIMNCLWHEVTGGLLTYPIETLIILEHLNDFFVIAPTLSSSWYVKLIIQSPGKIFWQDLRWYSLHLRLRPLSQTRDIKLAIFNLYFFHRPQGATYLIIQESEAAKTVFTLFSHIICLYTWFTSGMDKIDFIHLSKGL